MKGLPEPPNRGEPIRAELIRQMLDYMRRITPVAGPNIKVSIGPGGAKIEGTPGGEVQAEPLAPWAVRRHVTEGDAAGQWEIWLPPGCMSVGGDCTPLNKPASKKAGHEDDKPGWYTLRLVENEGEPTRTETAENENGGQVTLQVRDFSIIAHAKTSAKEYGVDALDAPARRLLYVEARKIPSSNESADATDEDRVAGTWGDEFAQTVSSVTVAVGGGKTSRRIVPRCKAPISAAARERTGFDLVWYFGFGANDALVVKALYCVRATVSAAGISITGDTMTDVTDATGIYARINTTDLTEGVGKVEVLKDPTNTNISTPYVVWLHLFSLTSNAVKADFRSQSLVNLQLFHA